MSKIYHLAIALLNFITQPYSVQLPHPYIKYTKKIISKISSPACLCKYKNIQFPMSKSLPSSRRRPHSSSRSIIADPNSSKIYNVFCHRKKLHLYHLLHNSLSEKIIPRGRRMFTRATWHHKWTRERSRANRWFVRVGDGIVTDSCALVLALCR